MRKRFLVLVMICTLLASALCPAGAEEAMKLSEKLYRQLWAGSGFTADLTADIADRNGVSLLKQPMQAALEYIYVRPAAEDGEGEHRLSIALKDGESDLSAFDARLIGTSLDFHADLLGEGRYALSGTGEITESSAAAEAGDTLQTALNGTGLPSLARTLLTVLPMMKSTDALTDTVNKMRTYIDLWLEGYRETTELGKEEDGTTTLSVSYTVSAGAIKAQVKQMLYNVLTDEQLYQAVTEAVGKETAETYFKPSLMQYYFDAVEALPLSGDATLFRTMRLDGGTTALHIRLPLYDAEGGTATLRYDRDSGSGDEPDEHIITLESDVRSLSISYREYSSMTDVYVMQGEVRSDPAAGASGDDQPAPFAFGYTFTQTEQTSRDDLNRDVYNCNLSLVLIPFDVDDGAVTVPDMELALNTVFVSAGSQKAATEITAQLVIGGEGLEHQFTFTLQGKSRKKWEPAAIEGTPKAIAEMSESDWLPVIASLLQGIQQIEDTYWRTEGDPLPEPVTEPETAEETEALDEEAEVLEEVEEVELPETAEEPMQVEEPEGTEAPDAEETQLPEATEPPAGDGEAA